MTTSDKIKKAIELNDSIVYAGTKLDAAKGALNVLGMFMSQIKEGVEDNHKQLNMIYQEIVSIQTHMHHLEKKTSDSIKINAPRIDPNQLQIPEPSEETKKRPNNPKMLKRIYLRNSTEVAYLSLSDDDKLYVSDEEEEQNEEMNEILSIEEGIRRHKLKTPEDRKVAWKIFSTNAEKSDYTAMYWKGIYLWEGHHIDNRSEEHYTAPLFNDDTDKSNGT
ncbi:10488_t:CDS:2 [Gigaspora rosea]|nr:10488_t:CDS:2 [Gigaspora rosea]